MSWLKPKSQTNKPKIQEKLFCSWFLSLLCCAEGQEMYLKCIHSAMSFSKTGKTKLSTRNGFLPSTQWPMVPVAHTEEQGLLKKAGYRRITFQRASVGNCRKHLPGLLSRKKQSLVLKHSNSWTRLSFSSLLSCHFSALGGVESGLGGRNTQAQKPAA